MKQSYCPDLCVPLRRILYGVFLNMHPRRKFGTPVGQQVSPLSQRWARVLAASREGQLELFPLFLEESEK